ncbi:Lipopolysaccharide biosynthesis protein WzxC [Methanosarcina siciliae HI350]|uniref:Lipopolysaccharide biosynthesis protein WzxC n=1 Tax=Methanosarcina siciliae HI350 TaxID=1434119 RepID=A0A0E3PFQ6_9EURY|nr:lipopolysaccharide biosynthesis protein [Methanosarcina siciliae]AKB33079.1 Lipopolysaccharide biosynthesis protein WzxC [Methanosarcina siciliae HI350]
MNSTNTLRYKTITGIIWTFLEQIFRVGIQTIVTIILAWFLLPEDFGLMAMIAVFFAIAYSLMDSGFSQALIRKKEVNQTDYSTVFYTNLVLGLLFYALLFASAPFIASFYDEPRLIMLARVVGLVVIINSFQLVQVADLTRKLNFKVQLKVTLPSAIFSGVVAVSMAAMGFGVWSLVAQMLISSFAATALYWTVNKWRPSKDFSVISLNEMFGFGSKLLASGLIDTAFQNIYVIVIGRLFSATLVGYYFFAQKIQMLVISQLTGSVQKVTYPALSSIQDDNTTLKAFYRRIIQVVTYTVFPFVIALAVLAKPLFSLMLKEDWLPAVPYLQLLCIAGLLYPLYAINLNILKVKGRSDLFLYLELVKKLMIVIIILVSVKYGIFGILIGQIVSSVIAYIPNSYFSIKLIDYSVTEQLHDFIPTLLLAVAMGIFMYAAGLVLSLGEFAYILVIGFAGAIFYLLTNHLLKMPAQLLMLQIIEEQYLKKS